MRLIPPGILILCSFALAYLALFAAFISTLSSGAIFPDAQEHAEIMEYLRGPLFAQEQLSFLTPEERSHMADVKALFDWAFILALAALGFLVGTAFALRRKKPQLEELTFRSAWWSGLALAAFCLFLVAAAALSFERLFTLFHAILFPQGNWTFPADSALIQLYPPRVFLAFALNWLARALAAAALLAGLGWLGLRMHAEERWFKS